MQLAASLLLADIEKMTPLFVDQRLLAELVILADDVDYVSETCFKEQIAAARAAGLVIGSVHYCPSVDMGNSDSHMQAVQARRMTGAVHAAILAKAMRFSLHPMFHIHAADRGYFTGWLPHAARFLHLLRAITAHGRMEICLENSFEFTLAHFRSLHRELPYVKALFDAEHWRCFASQRYPATQAISRYASSIGYLHFAGMNSGKHNHSFICDGDLVAVEAVLRAAQANLGKDIYAVMEYDSRHSQVQAKLLESIRVVRAMTK